LGCSTATLSRLANEKQGKGRRGTSVTLLRQIPVVVDRLEHVFIGWRRGRPLDRALDADARAIQDARDPYWGVYVPGGRRFCAQRDLMTPAKREAEWRTFNAQWPTGISYRLSFYEQAERNGDRATRNRRLVERRVRRGGLRDVDNRPPSPDELDFALRRQITRLATEDAAVARAWDHIRAQARLIRWQRTQHHQALDAPAQTERRQQAALQDGRPQIIIGTPLRRRRAPRR
jgi:hypothetical protein